MYGQCLCSVCFLLFLPSLPLPRAMLRTLSSLNYCCCVVAVAHTRCVRERQTEPAIHLGVRDVVRLSSSLLCANVVVVVVLVVTDIINAVWRTFSGIFDCPLS
jgi:hypothetical protein